MKKVVGALEKIGTRRLQFDCLVGFVLVAILRREEEVSVDAMHRQGLLIQDSPFALIRVNSGMAQAPVNPGENAAPDLKLGVM